MDPQTILQFLNGADDDAIVFQLSALESLNEHLAMAQVAHNPYTTPTQHVAATAAVTVP